MASKIPDENVSVDPKSVKIKFATHDDSLSRIFDRLNEINCNSIISPRWKNFKLSFADKTRINNAIWRNWQTQFKMGLKPRFCQFDLLEFDKGSHDSSQVLFLEGQDMKFNLRSEVLNSLINYNENNNTLPVKNSLFRESMSFLDQNLLLSLFPDTLFSCQNNLNHSGGFNNNENDVLDFMQPNLDQLNPCLSQFMEGYDYTQSIDMSPLVSTRNDSLLVSQELNEPQPSTSLNHNRDTTLPNILTANFPDSTTPISIFPIKNSKRKSSKSCSKPKVIDKRTFILPKPTNVINNINGCQTIEQTFVKQYASKIINNPQESTNVCTSSTSAFPLNKIPFQQIQLDSNQLVGNSVIKPLIMDKLNNSNIMSKNFNKALKEQNRRLLIQTLMNQLVNVLKLGEQGKTSQKSKKTILQLALNKIESLTNELDHNRNLIIQIRSTNKMLSEQLSVKVEQLSDKSLIKKNRIPQLVVNKLKDHCFKKIQINPSYWLFSILFFPIWESFFSTITEQISNHSFINTATWSNEFMKLSILRKIILSRLSLISKFTCLFENPQMIQLQLKNIIESNTTPWDIESFSWKSLYSFHK